MNQLSVKELEEIRLAALKVQNVQSDWREAVNALYFSPANKLAENSIGSNAMLIVCLAEMSHESSAAYTAKLAERIVSFVDSELNAHKAKQIGEEQYRQAQERQTGAAETADTAQTK